MSWLLPQLPPNWQAALRDVHAKDPRARAVAAARLAQPADDDRDAAVDALLTLCRDNDPRVRAPAMEALGELAEPRALPAISAATHDDDAYVRELAALALSRLPGDIAQAALFESASSTHPELRFHAISVLAERWPLQVEPVLRRLLHDADAKVRQSAVRAADTLPVDARSPELLRVLSDALRDGDMQVRGEAAVLFAKLGDARATGALLEALEDPELMWSALDAAPGIEDERVVEQVARIAQSFLRSRVVKAAAARALIRMRDPRGEEALREVLSSLRGDGRTYAVEIAGELGVAALVPLLVKMVRRPRGADTVALAKSLAQLAPENPEAWAALRELATHDDEAGALSHTELARLSSPGIAPSAAPPR